MKKDINSILKKILFLFYLLFFVNLFVKAQEVDDFINSIEVQKYLLLQEGKDATGKPTLFYIVDESNASYPLSDTTYFTFTGGKSNSKDIIIYIIPMNPLQRAISLAVSDSDDPSIKQFTNALINIRTLLEPFAAGAPMGANSALECKGLTKLSAKIDEINRLKDAVTNRTFVELFNSMKNAPFGNKDNASASIERASKELQNIKQNNDLVAGLVSETQNIIKDDLTCPIQSVGLALKVALSDYLQSITLITEERKLKLATLQEAFDLINTEYNKLNESAETQKFDKYPWSYKYVYTLDKGKIKNITAIVSDAGYLVSADAKALTSSSKELAKHVIRVWFKNPKVFLSVTPGLAFTQLTFPKYGTSTDPNGQLYITEESSAEVFKVNFAAMMNIHFNVGDDTFFPILQFGGGPIAERPALFTGGGFVLRNFSANYKNAYFGLSYGNVFLWNQELMTKRPGDLISEVDDLNDDLEWRLIKGFNPYLAISFKF
ncbi:hypothetical protein [Sabulibacter ruber]|uniref:hypothetical protein n=1 Tax=Sabulibacter ruber TaxID=2811901 RepID=UPI001A973B21|nr:hypothetical protein [Sabulibacter ruber]